MKPVWVGHMTLAAIGELLLGESIVNLIQTRDHLLMSPYCTIYERRRFRVKG